jgi:hypothetical protein
MNRYGLEAVSKNIYWSSRHVGPSQLNQKLNLETAPITGDRMIHFFAWDVIIGLGALCAAVMLPASLQAEVSLVLKKDFIEKVPFLKGASQKFVRDLAIELRPVIFSPGTYIFMAGEIGRHLYFINRGQVQVIDKDGTPSAPPWARVTFSVKSP